MQAADLLKKLLPGFIPLIVFVLADEIWGTKIGLIVAIAFGVLGLLYYALIEKRFDKFIFLDTVLIVALGGVSIVLDNDSFFKVKPAIISSILCIVLAVSAFTSKNIILSMSKRYMGGLKVNEEQEKQMTKLLKSMFFVFLAYTLLSFYSVWFMSKEAWAFINGGFLYVVFGLFFVVQWAKKWLAKRKFEKEEWLPLVDKEGQVIGKAPRSKCHQDKSLLHPVVHLHVFDFKGRLYLQKRPAHKLIQPGKWDTAVGGHISFGENVEQSLFREAEEEIGITDFEPKLVQKYLWESDVESEYVLSFVTQYAQSITIPNDEVEEGRFWTHNAIEKQMGSGIFTPNFEHEYALLKKIGVVK